VNNYKFGTSIPGLNVNVATEHTDVVPGFQAGIRYPVSVGTTSFNLGLTAGYYLPGSNEMLQVGNTVITNKVGGTAFIDASLSWEWQVRQFGLRD
jgi:hypothetical protein